jgi:hypothetical protein
MIVLGLIHTSAFDHGLIPAALGVTHMRSFTVTAGLVPAIHGLRVDPAEVVDAGCAGMTGTMRPSVGISFCLSV